MHSILLNFYIPDIYSFFNFCIIYSRYLSIRDWIILFMIEVCVFDIDLFIGRSGAIDLSKLIYMLTLALEKWNYLYCLTASFMEL